MINQPAEGLTLKDILQNMPEEIGRTGLVNMPIFIGGPVQGENGYVLFTAAPRFNDSEQVPVQVTQSVEILKDAARSRQSGICALCWAMPDGGRGNWRANCKIMLGWWRQATKA